MNAQDLSQYYTKLVALLEMMEVKTGDDGERYVEINNAHFTTDKITTEAVVTIDGRGSNGWQWPIMVTSPEGGYQATKCIGCDELAEWNHLMCQRCKKALITIRDLGDEQAVKVLSVLADPAMAGFFQLLTVDNFRKYMEEQIGAIGSDA